MAGDIHLAALAWLLKGHLDESNKRYNYDLIVFVIVLNPHRGSQSTRSLVIPGR